MYLLENVKNHVLESGAEYCTADFGTREPGYPEHHGIDLINDAGGACGVVAVADGEVIYTQTGVEGYDEIRTAGNCVKLRHANGYTTRYLHLAPDSVCVKVGQTVKAGDKLGIEGGTGYCIPEGAVHLHFDVNDGKNYIDPLPFLLGKKSFCYNGGENSETHSPSKIMVGDRVRLGNGAMFSDGTTPHDWVYGAEFDVQKLSRDGTEALIGIDGEPTGWVYLSDLYEIDCNTEDHLKVGDIVRVKAGATTYGGKPLAVFVYTQDYEVMQVGIEGKPDYIVIGQGDRVTAGVRECDLIKV